MWMVETGKCVGGGDVLTWAFCTRWTVVPGRPGWGGGENSLAASGIWGNGYFCLENVQSEITEK